MAAGFVDEVRVRVRAGDGGNGVASFHREKHKPRGGPNGGDGGQGGSVVLAADPMLGSLAPYLRRRSLRAAHGGKGGSNNRRGADGADVVVPVPVGTVARDAATKEVLADLAKQGARYVVARGGRGGRGNASLRGAHDRIPNYAERGTEGEQRELVLELHLVSDMGLVGPPNAGKSTLLGAISRAEPKIADYPFTTLAPVLGVAEGGGERFVVADLPGLIEGASEGKGLGLKFLRHAQRCALLAVVVDLAGTDPVADLNAVMSELRSYATDVAERVRLVVGNKIDLPRAEIEGARSWASDAGMRFVPVSAAHGTHLDDLLSIAGEEIAQARTRRGQPESFAVYRPVVEDRIEIVREGGALRVRSDRVERLVGRTPLDSPGAVRRLQRRLRTMGVETALRREGVQEGDEIRIGDVAFEYVPDR